MSFIAKFIKVIKTEVLAADEELDPLDGLATGEETGLFMATREDTRRPVTVATPSAEPEEADPWVEPAPAEADEAAPSDTGEPAVLTQPETDGEEASPEQTDEPPDPPASVQHVAVSDDDPLSAFRSTIVETASAGLTKDLEDTTAEDLLAELLSLRATLPSSAPPASHGD